jgi:hypothetical protein
MEIICHRDCCDARFLSTLADKENSAQQIYSSMVFWLATFHLGLENQLPMLQPGHSVVILFYVQRERNARAPAKGSIAIDVQKSFN